MVPEVNDAASESSAGSRFRDALSLRSLVLLSTGLPAGASLSVLLVGGAVALPLVGSAPAQAVGVAGLGVAGVGYKLSDCGAGDCGCSGDCGDSCSRDH